MADEGDPPVVHRPGRRLADVVQQGAEAQRAAARDLVRQRLGQQLGHLGRGVAGVPRQVGLDLEQVLEHRERVVVHVEVVVGGLRHPPELLELGQDHPRDPELVHQGEPPDRLGAAEDPAQLGELALAGGLGGEPRRGPRERDGLGVERRGRSAPRAARRAAGGAGRPRRSARRPRAADALSASPRPPAGSIASPPPRGTATALSAKSRAPQVLLDRLAAQRGHVGVPRVVRRDGPPGPVALGQREGEPARLAPDRLRHLALAALRAPPGRGRRPARRARRRGSPRRRSTPPRPGRARRTAATDSDASSPALSFAAPLTGRRSAGPGARPRS